MRAQMAYLRGEPIHGGSDIPYDELVRNFEKYVGMEIHKRGEIFQVVYRPNVNSTVPRDIQQIGITTNENPHEFYWMRHSGERYLLGDTVEFWGTVFDVYLYDNLKGKQIIAPWLNLTKIVRLE